MLGYILLILVGLVYIFSQIVSNASVFGQPIHDIYKELKRILISREYGKTDRFDDARAFIKSKNLTDDEISKLRTYIQIQRDRFSNSFSIGNVLVTLLITLITLMIGATISTTLGALFSTFSNSIYDNKIDVAQAVYKDLIVVAGDASNKITIIFIIGIIALATWGTYAKYWSEITLAALRVVEQEQEDRKQ